MTEHTQVPSKEIVLGGDPLGSVNSSATSLLSIQVPSPSSSHVQYAKS